MRPLPALLIGAVLALGGCRTPNVSRTSPAEANQTGPATIPSVADVIPAGTPLQVQVEIPASARPIAIGDDVRATLTQQVIDNEGRVLLPVGTPVVGEVTDVERGPGKDAPPAVEVDFEVIGFDGKVKRLDAEIARDDGAPLTDGTRLTLRLTKPVLMN